MFLLSFLVVTAVFVSSTQAAQPISGTAPLDFRNNLHTKSGLNFSKTNLDKRVRL